MVFDKQISRRTLAKGAAWSVPAVMVATAAPAAAASPETPEIAGTACKIFFGTGGVNGQRTKIFLAFASTDGEIKAGDTTVYNFTFSRPVNVPQLATNARDFTMTAEPASGSSSNIRITVTANRDNPETLATCNDASPSVNWDDSASSGSPVMPPNTQIGFESFGTRDGKPTDGAAGLTFVVPQRFPTSINKRGRTPVRYISRSGLQTEYPETRFSIRGSVDNGRSPCGEGRSGSSVVYPDGACASLTTSATGGQDSVPARP